MPVPEKITELKLNLIPYADDEEMQEIDNIFEEPENYQNQEFDEVVF